MIKKELEKLRALNATKAMINALEEPGRQKDWDKKIHKYKYRHAARCQQLSGYLKISICTRKDVKNKIYIPKWDIFLNYEGDEYITRERQDDGTYKWRTAYIYNLEDGYYWCHRDYDQYMYINPEGRASIQAVLKTKNKGYEGIQEWQEGCKKRREDARIKKLTDQWDAQMKPVKDPPKGFESWWQHNGFDGQHYIFYSGAGAREGYCTSCLKKVGLTTPPSHNIQGKCPKCRKGVQFISRAKKHTRIYSWERYVSCIQRYKDGLIQRDYSIRRIDIKDADMINRSEFTIREYRRTLITGAEYQVFIYDDYKRRGRRWYKSPDQKIERYAEKMYPKNLSRLLKNSHTAYIIAVEHGYHTGGILYFLTMERKYPVIEMAYKAGLYTLAKDMLNKTWLVKTLINSQQRELAKILGIDKARMQRLKKMEGDLRSLIWLQYEKVKDTIYRDSDIMTLTRTEIEPETVQKSKISNHLSIEKICNYLNKQNGIRRGSGHRGGLNQIWRDWNDYINMMKKLKMDCTKELLLKPKDLIIAHNELVARISMKDAKKEINARIKKYRKAERLLESGELKKYEYQDEKYCIVAPKGIADIYEEGLTLKHCIHTCDIYFQRIDIRETYLLFLRRADAPDRPWYTLEIEPGGNIRQKKSVLNEAYRDLDDALPFLRKWQQALKKKLSEEDRKLAEKSDKARKAGYEKLREEKKIIWHGRLQGTLLVDALEDDFMEAM